MVTTNITIAAYLAEYLIGKFNNGNSDTPVHFPDNLDIYHIVWSLLLKRPSNISPIDKGNLSIYLPNRREGKDPSYYNYISNDGASIIEKNIRAMFYIELRQQLNDNRERGHFYQDQEIIYLFLARYNVSSISVDALQKNYLRWRNTINQARKRRRYSKTLNI